MDSRGIRTRFVRLHEDRLTTASFLCVFVLLNVWPLLGPTVLLKKFYFNALVVGDLVVR